MCSPPSGRRPPLANAPWAIASGTPWTASDDDTRARDSASVPKCVGTPVVRPASNGLDSGSGRLMDTATPPVERADAAERPTGLAERGVTRPVIHTLWSVGIIQFLSMAFTLLRSKVVAVTL